jgi:hypothetical protein
MASFPGGLNEQVGHEFAASQQYVAIAVHYDAQTLPRLAVLPTDVVNAADWWPVAD